MPKSLSFKWGAPICKHFRYYWSLWFMCIMVLPKCVAIKGKFKSVSANKMFKFGVVLDNFRLTSFVTATIANIQLLPIWVWAWELFPHYWLSLRGIHRPSVNTSQRASAAELWCFPCSEFSFVVRATQNKLYLILYFAASKLSPKTV